MSVFGPLVRRDHVEKAVRDHVRKWLDSHLGEVERTIAAEQSKPAADFKGALEPIKSWSTRKDFDLWPEDKVPAFMSVAVDATKKRRDGEGAITKDWALGAMIVVDGADVAPTHDLASYYGGALCQALLQHGVPGGFAAIDYVNESYAEPFNLPEYAERTFASAAVYVIVTTEQSVNDLAGPVGEPQPDPRAPYPDDPTALTVTVTRKHRDDA